MTLRTFFPYILYVNDVITPGAVNFRNQSEPVRVNISGEKHSVTPYVFYIKPPSWIEGKIESVTVSIRVYW